MARPIDLPTTGNPNTSREKRDRKGNVIQRRYYGGDGKAIINIDFDHDHGDGKPHAHDWVGSKIHHCDCRVELWPRMKKAQAKAMRIVTYKDYVAGWLDTSIHDFLETLAPNAAGTRYALITTLDSNPNPAALRDKSPELKALRDNVDVRGSGLLVRTSDLLDKEPNGPIFFGFDELWLFPTKSIKPKPMSVSIVGPARPTQERLNKIGKWMAANNCSMALGGGEGLNFIVRARGLTKFLLGSSLEQRDPAHATMEPSIA